MITYNIPADFKEENVIKIASLNNKYSSGKIKEAYGQITVGNKYGSSRSSKLIKSVDINTLKNYINTLRKYNISFAYTLNPICIDNKEFDKNGVNDLKIFSKKLRDIGVETIIIAMPSIMEIIKHTVPEIKIRASAVCHINNVKKALFYKSLGVDSIVLDIDIIRDFKKIKKICDIFPNSTEIIVNNTCQLNCPYRIFHYCHEAHAGYVNQDIDDYYFIRCNYMRYEKPESYLQISWIRPEDIKYYFESGIIMYKVQGRQDLCEGGDVLKTTEQYLKGSYEGNLVNLLTNFRSYNAFTVYIDNKSLEGFIHDFYYNSKECTSNCRECGYCMKYVRKCVKGDINNLNNYAVKFYREYDKFNKMITNDYE